MKKRMNADERSRQLVQQGLDPKTCWCLDCINLGQCANCDGKGTQHPTFFHPRNTIPPEKYERNKDVKIKEFY